MFKLSTVAIITVFLSYYYATNAATQADDVTIVNYYAFPESQDDMIGKRVALARTAESALRNAIIGLDMATRRSFSGYISVVANTLLDNHGDYPGVFQPLILPSQGFEKKIEQQKANLIKVLEDPEIADLLAGKTQCVTQAFDTFVTRYRQLYSAHFQVADAIISTLNKLAGEQRPIPYADLTQASAFGSTGHPTYIICQSSKKADVLKLLNIAEQLREETILLAKKHDFLSAFTATESGKHQGVLFAFAWGNPSVKIVKEGAVLPVLPEIMRLFELYAQGVIDQVAEKTATLALWQQQSQTEFEYFAENPFVTISAEYPQHVIAQVPTRIFLHQLIENSTAVMLLRIPKTTRMFTPRDDALFRDINRKIETFRVTKTGRTPAGQRAVGGAWGGDEMIMNYANTLEELFPQINELLSNQFLRRGIKVDPVEVKGAIHCLFAKGKQQYLTHEQVTNSASELKIWFDIFALDKVLCQQGIDYIYKKANAVASVDDQGPANNRKLLKSLWQLKALHQEYQGEKWQAVKLANSAFDANLQALLIQAAEHVQAHNGRCAKGAMGRSLLNIISMIDFLMQNHPDFPVQ